MFARIAALGTLALVVATVPAQAAPLGCLGLESQDPAMDAGFEALLETCAPGATLTPDVILCIEGITGPAGEIPTGGLLCPAKLFEPVPEDQAVALPQLCGNSEGHLDAERRASVCSSNVAFVPGMPGEPEPDVVTERVLPTYCAQVYPWSMLCAPAALLNFLLDRA